MIIPSRKSVFLQAPPPQQPQQPIPRKTHAVRNLVIVVIVVVVLIGAGIVALSAMNALKAAKNTSGGNNTNSTSGTGNIVNGQFTVNAGSYKAYQFTIPSSWSSGWVVGSYTIGGGNMTFWVFTASGFSGWQNNDSNIPNYYCYSGVWHGGSLDCRIPAGSYYLLFDNMNSKVFGHAVDTTTSKTVNAQIGVQDNP